MTFSFNGFTEKSLTFYATSTLSVPHPVASSIFMEAGESPRVIIMGCLPLNDTRKKKNLLITGITINYTY